MREPTYLFDVLEDHVAVSVECFDAGQHLLVVAERNQDLRVVADRLLQDREGALRDLVLLQLADLALIQVRLGDIDVLTVERRQYCDRECVGDTTYLILSRDGRACERDDGESDRIRRTHVRFCCAQCPY